MKYFLLSFFLVSAPTYACLPAPVNLRVDVKNLLISQLMTNDWASLENLQSAEVSNLKVLSYEWIKSDPGFQCHDKEMISADVFVQYVNEKDQTCTTQGAITVTNSMYEGAPRPEFKIEDLSSTCKVE